LSLLRASLILSFLSCLGCSIGSDGSNEESTAGADSSGTGGAATGGSGGSSGGSGGTSNAGKGGNAQGGTGPSAGSPSASGTSGEAGESATGGAGGGTGASGGTGGSGMGASAGTGGSAASGSGAGGTASGAGGQIGNHTNPLSQALIDAFVTAHNAARARKDLDPLPNPPLPPVTWDAMLADAAYNYLSRCEVSAGGEQVEHNDDRTEDYAALGGSDYVGENLYASTGTSVEPSDAVDSWMNEQSEYDYSKNDFDVAGHYTQVVWRDSVRIGCAIVNCPNARFSNTVLCDYAPGGNINGQKPY
jgi:pathogenesis-related protein 1